MFASWYHCACLAQSWCSCACLALGVIVHVWLSLDVVVHVWLLQNSIVITEHVHCEMFFVLSLQGLLFKSCSIVGDLVLEH